MVEMFPATCSRRSRRYNRVMKAIARLIIKDGKPSPDPYHAAAVERGRAAVRRLQEMGIIDAEGRLLRKGLPPDMEEGKDRDFGG